MWTMRPTSQPPTVLGPVNLLLSASGFREQVNDIIVACNNVLFHAVPPTPVLSAHGSKCNGKKKNFTVLWNVSSPLINQTILFCSFLPSQIPHPPPPPAYEPVEAVWVNYTVEKEDGATSEMSSGPLPPSTESFVIENATLGATYTITVSAINQLGWSGSTTSIS